MLDVLLLELLGALRNCGGTHLEQLDLVGGPELRAGVGKHFGMKQSPHLLRSLGVLCVNSFRIAGSGAGLVRHDDGR
ncbi:hypothetical protein BDY17DRAFT_290358 [Neohortaea acidophila]|uniref:Uncharacterized protein n=1 Tax=Neohortaea acidophila TaxID=245834 RepID=A0A6A6Q8B0_9PEZI|nr:uncharacterized protein BDY17DRAFT_290358 [Neohortaea acidophila]KAF2488176.1 hypothetical protein BDY17DRAFT_290358 [Neohortaea acidophila]